MNGPSFHLFHFPQVLNTFNFFKLISLVNVRHYSLIQTGGARCIAFATNLNIHRQFVSLLLSPTNRCLRAFLVSIFSVVIVCAAHMYKYSIEQSSPVLFRVGPRPKSSDDTGNGVPFTSQFM